MKRDAIWKSVENRYTCNVGGAIHKNRNESESNRIAKKSVTPDKARKRQLRKAAAIDRAPT
jgi:hypothetical protein